MTTTPGRPSRPKDKDLPPVEIIKVPKDESKSTNESRNGPSARTNNKDKVGFNGGKHYHDDDDDDNENRIPKEYVTLSDDAFGSNADAGNENGSGNGGMEKGTTRSPVQPGKRSTVQQPGAPRAKSRPVFDTFNECAEKATREVKGDVQECKITLRNHSAEPNELLHLIEHWLHKIIEEFKGDEEKIKLFLEAKWHNKELRGQHPDVGLRQRELLNSIKHLEEWRQTKLQAGEELLRTFESREEDGSLRVDTEKLQEALGGFIDELIKVNQCINYVRDYKSGSETGSSYRDSSKDCEYLAARNVLSKPGSSDAHHAASLAQAGGDEAHDQSNGDAPGWRDKPAARGSFPKPTKHDTRQIQAYLGKMKELNKKSTFTIVIVGLEKAGKSTFINAILGSDILPSDPERCTQVHTIILPSKEAGMKFTVEFRSGSEFEEVLSGLTAKEDESQAQLQDRKDKIRRACKEWIGADALTRVARSQEEEKRLREEMREFLANHEKMYVVRTGYVFTQALGNHDVAWEIHDVPGWDSVIEEHRHIAMEAISKADAFIMLTNGTRPSLTEPQVQFLTRIKEEHYDAMSKAFGVITWLDSLGTVDLYNEHLAKAKAELLRFRFLKENIFPVCSIVPLGRSQNAKDKHRELLANLKQKLKDFPGLAEGYDDCLFAIKYCVKNELPIKRRGEAIDLAKKHILNHVNEALVQARLVIPDYITNDEKLEDVIKTGNAERWGHIFASERFQPTREAAHEWKNRTIIYEREARGNEIMDFFEKCFDTECKRANIQVENLAALMIRDSSTGFQLTHWVVEDKHRKELVEQFVAVIERVARQLAEYLYECNVEKLVDLLNQRVCPEEPYVFTTSLRVEQCQYETTALLKRVAIPIIQATLGWAHNNTVPRENAVKELAKVVPWVALNLSKSETNDAPELSKLVREVCLGRQGSGGTGAATGMLAGLQDFRT